MDMTLITLRSLKSELEERKEKLSSEFRNTKSQNIEGELVGTLVAINIIEDHIKTISKYEKENIRLKENCKFVIKQRQICDKDIEEIKILKSEGYSYSYISKVTGWSKATISRVINNTKGIY